MCRLPLILPLFSFAPVAEAGQAKNVKTRERLFHFSRHDPIKHNKFEVEIKL